MLNYITSGESHGEYLIAVLEGMPSGITLDRDKVNAELARRQRGYGRGPRMAIETDTVVITSGVYRGKTTGAPITLMIKNQEVNIDKLPQLERPRPGHADLIGALKYDQGIRQILERSSARETALRVAVGSVARQCLELFNIAITAHVTRIGSASVKEYYALSFREILEKKRLSKLNCISPSAEKAMMREIEKALKAGDTVGGEFEVVACGIPLGLGSHVHYARKLDARIAAALMSVQAIKAVQFGIGVHASERFGSRVHDEIFYTRSKGYYRKTNNAGGLEGGMSNGEALRVTASMKPIATLKKPLSSVDMKTKRPKEACFERSDICAVSACSVVGEAVVAFEILNAFLEKFGGDSLREIKRNFSGYVKQIGQK
jgi:chorismate synthase